MDFTVRLGTSRMGTELIWNGASNSHLYVSGQSGRGKSFFLRYAISQLPQQGIRCIVFDYAGDLRHFPPETCANLNTSIECLDIRTQIGINPFRTLVMQNGQPEYCYDTAARVAETILSATPVRGDLQKLCLRNVLAKYLEQYDTPPGISGLIHQIRSDQELARTMRPTLLRLQDLDNLLPCRPQNFCWNLEHPGITVLQFDSLPNLSTQIILTQFLLFDLWSEKLSHYQDTCPVVVVLDECQRFRFTEGSILHRILREGRKYGFSGWFASQWLNDQSAVEALNRAGLLAYFYPGNEQVNTLARRLAHGAQSAKDYKKLIQGLAIGEFLYIDGRGIPIINRVPKMQHAQYAAK